jgi:hypothetical protein
MYDRKRIGLFVSLGVAAILVMAALPVSALSLQASTTWEESGDTIVHGTFVGNVGGTSGPEIVTVGEAVSGSPAIVKAQIRVYEFNGSALNLRDSELCAWGTATVNVYLAVYAADLDSNGSIEILAVGYSGNTTIIEPLISIWHYDGSSLTGVSNVTEAVTGAFRSVYTVNLIGDSDPEVVVAGDQYNSATGVHQGYLLFYGYDNTTLGRGAEVTWTSGDDVIAYSVHALDVDADNVVEIMTAGYTRDSTASPKVAELRVWNYTGAGLVTEASDPWYENPNQDAVWYGVYDADVGGATSAPEIVVCGYYYYSSGGINENRGKVWVYSKGIGGLTQEKQYWWDSGVETVCRSVYAKDVNGDTYTEMVTGGWNTTTRGTYNGEILVLNWTQPSDTITLLDSAHWYTTSHTRVNSVFAANADSGSAIEIVSGGRAYDGGNDRGELRVWHT